MILYTQKYVFFAHIVRRSLNISGAKKYLRTHVLERNKISRLAQYSFLPNL